jgi:hypothetical protein
MSDETIRTLIEVVGTVLAALIGAVSTITVARLSAAKQQEKASHSDRAQPAAVPRPPAARTNNRTVLILAGGLAGALLGYFLAPVVARVFVPPKPSLAITDPPGGAVGVQVMVRGTYANLPDNATMWLLVYSHTSNRYYPQSNLVTRFETGGWQSQILVGREGTQDAGQRFDIVAALADQDAHHQLLQYLEQAAKNGDYSGLVDLPDRLQLYDQVTVTRQ